MPDTILPPSQWVKYKVPSVAEWHAAFADFENAITALSTQAQTQIAGISSQVAVQVTAAARALKVSARQFGCVGDGVIDDTANFLTAVAYCKANKRSLYLPAGKYVLSGAVAWSTAGAACVIEGDGPNLTILSWTVGASTRGLSVTLDQDIHPFVLSNLTLETLGAGGTAITLDGSAQNQTGGSNPAGGVVVNRTAPRFVLDNVVVRGGADQFNTYWAKGFVGTAVIIGTVNNCSFEGGYGGTSATYKATTAIEFGDTSTTGQPTQFVVSNTSIYGWNNGIVAHSVQGVQVQTCTIVGVENGVVFDGHSVNGAQPHCLVMGSHINANLIGVWIENGNAPMILGNLIYRCSDGAPGQGTGYGVHIHGTDAGTGFGQVCNNCFVNTHQSEGMTAIDISGANCIVVDGNVFEKFFGSSAMSGISVLAGSAGNRIGANNAFKAHAGAGSFGFKVLDQGTQTILPGMNVVLQRGASQAVAANVASTVVWDTVISFKGNSGSWVPGAPSQVTIGVDGLYRVNCNLQWDYTGGGTRASLVLINGIALVGSGQNIVPASTATGLIAQNFSSAPLPLHAGDIVTLSVVSSVDTNIVGSADTWISVERIADL